MRDKAMEPPRKRMRISHAPHEFDSSMDAKTNYSHSEQRQEQEIDFVLIKKSLLAEFEGSEQEFSDFFLNFVKTVENVNEIKHIYEQQSVLQNQVISTKFKCCIDFSIEVAKLFDAAKSMKRKNASKPFTHFIVDLFQKCQIFQRNAMIGFSSTKHSYGYICKWRRAKQQITALKALWNERLRFVPGTDFTFVRKADLTLTEFRLSADWCNKVIPTVQSAQNLQQSDAIKWLMSDDVNARKYLIDSIKKNSNTLPFHHVIPKMNLEVNDDSDDVDINSCCNAYANQSPNDEDQTQNCSKSPNTDQTVMEILSQRNDGCSAAEVTEIAKDINEKEAERNNNGYVKDARCDETNSSEAGDESTETVTDEDSESEYHDFEEQINNLISKRRKPTVKALKLIIQRLKTKYENRIAKKNEEIAKLKSKIKHLQKELQNKNETISKSK